MSSDPNAHTAGADGRIHLNVISSNRPACRRMVREQFRQPTRCLCLKRDSRSWAVSSKFQKKFRSPRGGYIQVYFRKFGHLPHIGGTSRRSVSLTSVSGG